MFIQGMMSILVLIAAIVLGIIEILLEIDFYNNFFKYKMSQFIGLKGR